MLGQFEAFRRYRRTCVSRAPAGSALGLIKNRAYPFNAAQLSAHDDVLVCASAYRLLAEESYAELKELLSAAEAQQRRGSAADPTAGARLQDALQVLERDVDGLNCALDLYAQAVRQVELEWSAIVPSMERIRFTFMVLALEIEYTAGDKLDTYLPAVHEDAMAAADAIRNNQIPSLVHLAGERRYSPTALISLSRIQLRARTLLDELAPSSRPIAASAPLTITTRRGGPWAALGRRLAEWVDSDWGNTPAQASQTSRGHQGHSMSQDR